MPAARSNAVPDSPRPASRRQRERKAVDGAAAGSDLHFAAREKILAQVWKETPHITPHTVDVHIAGLRQKIEDEPGSPAHIVTVRGEGYRFEK